ncbi:MAG: COG3650 family protein [Hyphomonadaceae bacterium]
MRALVLALTLAACAEPAQQAETPAAIATEASPEDVEAALAQMPSWPDARAAGVDFRAVGQEPGWIADIYQRDRIRVLLDYGQSVTDFPLPIPTYPAEGAIRYETQRDGRTLVINVRRFPCADAMSGEPYPATVELVVDGRTLSGCGKSV